MKCPTCGAWTRVLETRQGVNRRRECANGHRFSTQEVAVAVPARPPAPKTEAVPA